MFDLGADPMVIGECLGSDRLLRRTLARHPGIRTPGAWDGFELAVRAILGQQVTVRAATTMAARLAERFGSPIAGPSIVCRSFPTPEQLMAAAIESIGVVRSRAHAIRSLARAVAAGAIRFGAAVDSRETLTALTAIPGIGEWTAQYIAMRALTEPDAFPSGDLVLRRMAGDCSARELDRDRKPGVPGAPTPSCCSGRKPWTERGLSPKPPKMLQWLRSRTLQKVRPTPAAHDQGERTMHKWTRLGAAASLATLLTATAWAQTTAPAVSPSTPPGASTIVEIRSYNLKPGTRERFHQLFVNTSLPMLRRWKVDVVAFGPSAHDTDSWFLMRGFPSLEARQKSEDAFYASEEWIKGPREAVLADIASYTTVIISIDHATLAGLRKTGARTARAEDAMLNPSSSDLTTLLRLNQDYIDSVQHSNVQRFSEILADDFLCSLPDGSLIDRAQFLSQTARPVTISKLAAEDVNVRIMGDMAIIHARTTYQTADGKAGAGRYTDVWARRDGRWLAVSAHVTRN